MNLFARRESIVLEIHQVFLRPLDAPANKNLLFKTAGCFKARGFLQVKEEIHGKADACRGFLMPNCRKISALERINPCVGPPLEASFYL